MTIEAVFGSPLPEISVEGDHLLLRPFRHDDLSVIEEASRDELIPKITSVPADFSPEAGLAFIDRQHDRLTSGAGWSLAIAERATDRALGQVGLWISQLGKGRADIGYWVAESARGRGAAAEAVHLVSEWAFEHLDVDRLSLYIEPWNTASLATAERAGFRREAILEGWERIDGEARDMWSCVRMRPAAGASAQE